MYTEALLKIWGVFFECAKLEKGKGREGRKIHKLVRGSTSNPLCVSVLFRTRLSILGRFLCQ